MSLRSREGLRRLALLLIVVVGVVAMASFAEARAGGGHSFSSGHNSGGGGYSGSGYGGGGGGGGGFGMFLLIRGLLDLTFTHPLIGLPLDAFLIYLAYKLFSGRATSSQTWQGSSDRESELNVRAVSTSAEVKTLRETLDENFSLPVFLDFVNLLYSEVQRARGLHKTNDLSAYLSVESKAELAALSVDVKAVDDVLVGECQIEDLSGLDETSAKITMTISFASNYMETSQQGAEKKWFSQERWVFSRIRTVKSKAPEHLRALSCPACGAPLAADPLGACPSCGTRVTSGTYDWFVESIDAARTQVAPDIEGDSDDEGLRIPSVIDPGLHPAFNQYVAKHPEFTAETFGQRVRSIFPQIQAAWSERDWQKARPFETDHLFQTQLFWIERYKEKKLINTLKNVQISRVEIVRLEEDRYYASITARIYSSMIDVTVTESGQVVAGDPTYAKEFSEYWTLIKGQRTPKIIEGKGAADACPACGAPLKISMAGVCEYCKTKITSGDFDWVLSRIEQPSTYVG